MVADHQINFELSILRKNWQKKIFTHYKEALFASSFLNSSKAITLCGSSMGWYIAIKLLRDLNVKKLILFCPALYTRHAFDIPFWWGFSDLIRQYESWRDSDAPEYLREFTGDVIVIIWDEDMVIPPWILEILSSSCTSVHSFEIIKIPNCTHLIHDRLSQEKWLLDSIIQKL